MNSNKQVNTSQSTANKSSGLANTSSNTKRITSKQVVAIIGIILLVLLYIVTLIVAIFDKSESGRLFFLCLFSTIVFPILIFIYSYIYGRISGRHAVGDAYQDDKSSEEGK